MISEHALQSALDDYLNTVATAEGLVVHWPGQGQYGSGTVSSSPQPSQTETVWLEPSVFTRNNRALSLGRGYEEDAGTYQIAIVSLLLQGPYPLHVVSDKLRPYYRRGMGTTVEGRSLMFDRADPRPPFDSGGNFRLPFLVPFSVFAPG